MASAPPENDGNLHDKEFEEAFSKFAAKAPDEEAAPQIDPPEGNDPEEPVASGDEPPAKAPSEDVTSGQAAGGDEPPAETAPDPWAHLPQEARDHLAQLQRERDEARHKAQSDANRVAALSRKLAQQQAAGSALTAPPTQPNEAQKALDEKITQLRKDYGDIADPIIELIEAQRNELQAVRSVVSEVATERQQAAVEAETKALEERHPDWRQVASSPDFAGWLEAQPENVQRLASSWDARESSVVLTLFKTERAETTGGQGAGNGVATATPETAPAATAAQPDARRTAQLDAGRDVRSRPAPASSGPPEDFDAAFDYFAKKRDAQKR